VGRLLATGVFALLALGACESNEADGSTETSGDAACKAAECERGEPCGCEGMDPLCDCESCQFDGTCHAFDDFSCEPVSDADCRRPGGACELFGHCQLVMGEFGPRCEPVSDADCSGSMVCTRYGACTYEPALGQCVVASSDDCAGSEVCRELTCCEMVDSECVRSTGSCEFECCDGEFC
jgi:hypothetical protein